MNSSTLDIGGLLRVLAVHEAGSFAGASRQLGVSRQAVHRSVASVEEAVGAPLFDKEASGLRLTTFGRELVEHALELRALQQRVGATIEQSRTTPFGLVRVTAPPLFSDTILPDAIARFLSKWPEVRVQAVSESARTRLVEGDFDLMVRVGGHPPEEHYAVLLGRVSTVLCASPAYVRERGAPDSPTDLGAHPLLSYGPQRVHHWFFQHGEDELIVEVEPRLSTDAPSTCVQACLAGCGVLRVPELAVRDALGAGSLVRVLPDWHVAPVSVWAVYGHRTQSDATLSALVEELTAAWHTAQPDDE